MGIYEGAFTREISFPLGGIGSGSIGLGGNGRLMDWEIFNRPNKGSLNGFSHIAVKAIDKDGRVYARILNGDLQKDFIGQYSKQNFSGYGYGPNSRTMAGFPHFAKCRFTGEFPLAKLEFADDAFPAPVTLTAFNPFIPGKEDDSSIPAAFFTVAFSNPTDAALDLTAAFSVMNPFSSGRNVALCGDYTGITLQNAADTPTATSYGDLTLATDCPDTQTQLYWYRGRWQDGIATYWHDFAAAQPMRARTYDTPGKEDTATLCAQVHCEPGQTREIRFVLSWNCPNNYNYWDPCKDEQGNDCTWKNYYAVLFKDSAASAAYSLRHFASLYAQTADFKNALFSVTADSAVIDAISSTLSVLKSPTVLRLEDGSFYGWEGVHEMAGSCEGTCTHVWNYAYALCFLFPRLERSIRELDYRYNQQPDGRMRFRMTLPVGREGGWKMPCVDGEMGGIIKLYREWKISGDTAWLKELWPKAKRSLEFAWDQNSSLGWDKDCDGVLEGRQHHTLDMELFGPSSWLEGFYLAALKAAAEISDALGEPTDAEKYRALFANGSRFTEEHLFNGKYYQQQVDLTDKSVLERYEGEFPTAVKDYWNEEAGQLKYQIADGCEIDQLCAQWHADIVGLGDIFDKTNRHIAAKNLFANNYKASLRDFCNPWRVFGCNDESASIICTYPEGTQKPIIPLPYCEECMHGFEYQLAGLLIGEGYVEEGLQVVRAVRGRYNGSNRNPWNEIECGNNYARSMASFALLPLLAGFTFDMTKGAIGFMPRVEIGDGFTTLFSLDCGWGTCKLNKKQVQLTVHAGSLPLRQFTVPHTENVAKVLCDGEEIPFTVQNGALCLQTIVQKTLQVLYR